MTVDNNNTPSSAGSSENVTHGSYVKPWAAKTVFTGYFANLVYSILIIAVALAVLLPLTIVLGYDLSNDKLETMILKTPLGMLILMLLTWAPFIFIPYYVSKKRGQGSLAKDFGLKFEVKDIFVGFGFAIIMLTISLSLTYSLKFFGFNVDAASNVDSMILDKSFLALCVAVISTVVGPPIVEELFFRGFILRGLLRSFAKTDLAEDKRYDNMYNVIPEDYTQMQRLKSVIKNPQIHVSVLLSAFLFGLMHSPTITSVEGLIILVVQVSLMGVFLGFLSIVRGNLGANIYAHAFYNGAALLSAVLLPNFF